MIRSDDSSWVYGHRPDTGHRVEVFNILETPVLLIEEGELTGSLSLLSLSRRNPNAWKVGTVGKKHLLYMAGIARFLVVIPTTPATIKG